MNVKSIQLNENLIKWDLKELVRSSVEEALTQIYPADVSVRRIDDITEASWGIKESPRTISKTWIKRLMNMSKPGVSAHFPEIVFMFM